MKVLVHENKKRALVLALNDEDCRTLELLDKNHLLFGLYQTWYQNPEGRGKDEPTIAGLLMQYPELQGIGWLNIVIDFVPGEIKHV